MDVFWGFLFSFPCAAILILKATQGEDIYLRQYITMAFVVFWGLRLTVHIILRHSVEDQRFVEMRENWMQGGLTSYYIKAFIFFFIA